MLKQLAHYDPLTGLENRTLITEQLNLRLAHCKREKTQLAVLFLDLDGFKAVNDEYGHKIGDKLLVIVAGRLQRTLRDSDVSGRLGGDEFIVILESGAGELAPKQVAEKIKKSIRRPATIDSITVQVSVSIGIACYPDDGDTVDVLMSISDTAMYADKKKQKKARPNKPK